MADIGRPMEIVFPRKGVHATGPRQAQPDGTVPPEALYNMVPYDRTGRARGASRPGCLHIGNQLLAAPVAQMTQVSLVIDPATVVATTPVFTENWSTYVNGTDVNTTTNWAVYNGIPGGGGTRVTGLTTVEPADYVTGWANFSTAPQIVLYNGTPVNLGKSYVIRAVFTFDGTSNLMQIFARANGQAIGPGVELNLQTNSLGAAGSWTINIQDPQSGSHVNTTASVGGGFSATAGQQITLELRVAGDTMTGWVNGTQYVGTTNTWGNQYQNFGFGYGTSGNANSRVNTFTVLSGISANYRRNQIVAACGGSVFQGDLTGLALCTGGSAILNAGVKPQMCWGQQKCYIVDGTSIIKVDIASAAVQAYTATAGVAPTGCTICTLFRDRLVLSGDPANPQNVYFSRVGTHTDWDYSQVDPAAAFASNSSLAGHIGEPVTALIPLNDDLLLIGGDHNLWMVRGDPADGGSIDLISDNVGILGPDAWCKSPEGTLYFCGTGGLYRMAGETQPQEVAAGTYLEFFRTIDRAQNFVMLEWDHDRHGAYIFVTPVEVHTQGTGLWYDAREDGYFPVQFPNDVGPHSMYAYDGDSASQRTVLMGGRSGLIRQMGNAYASDDGQAIVCFARIGPFKAGAMLGYSGSALPGSDLNEGLLNQLTVILGEVPSGFTEAANWNCAFTVKSGHDANTALNSPQYSRTKTFTKAGRQPVWVLRQRGVAFFFELANSIVNKFFNFERATVWIVPAGRERR